MSLPPHRIPPWGWAVAASASAFVAGIALFSLRRDKKEEAYIEDAPQYGLLFRLALRLGLARLPYAEAFDMSAQSFHQKLRGILADVEKLSLRLVALKKRLRSRKRQRRRRLRAENGGADDESSATEYSSEGQKRSETSLDWQEMLAVDELLQRAQLRTDSAAEDLQRILDSDLRTSEGTAADAEGRRLAAKRYRPTCRQLTARVQQLLAEVDEVREELKAEKSL